MTDTAAKIGFAAILLTFVAACEPGGMMTGGSSDMRDSSGAMTDSEGNDPNDSAGQANR